jgi:hypothetical protein
MVNDLFAGMMILYFLIAMPFALISIAYMEDDDEECSMTEWG